MRLLIYGFGPYRQFQDNVTEKIVRQFPRRTRLKKTVFPVRFYKSQFINAIKDHKPDVILGLGQCSRGRGLRIERQAANRRRNGRYDKPKPIIPRGRPTLRTNLKLSLKGRSSNNAGAYVCNYSMYVMLDFITRRHLPVRYGFVHIPHRYDYKKALRLLTDAIGKIEAAS
jgi:pyrrolidone-carboxylate peptidase